MNWYFIGGIAAAILAIVLFILFTWLVLSIEKLEVGKHTARFTGVAFALLGYYVLFPNWLPTPSYIVLQWMVPAIAGCFAGFYALQAVRNYDSELVHFLKHNLTIAGAIILLVLSTTLLGVSEKAFIASSGQSSAQPESRKSAAPFRSTLDTRDHR